MEIRLCFGLKCLVSIGLLLVFLSAPLHVWAAAAEAAAWTPTGSLISGRVGHSATLLANGKVLVAGGYAFNGTTEVNLDSAELYDPISRTWSATGRMNEARGSAHTATLLDNGMVLVTGGLSSLDNTAELYDPASGTWSLTGNLNVPRANATATLLKNGKVLLAGGGLSANTASAEIYDPAASAWTLTGSLNTARFGHTATRLLDGRVLVVGGDSGSYDPDIEFPPANRAEIYDSATGAWTYFGGEITVRGGSATLLGTGKVLIAGGFQAISCGSGCQTSVPAGFANLYDPATSDWTPTGHMADPVFGTGVLLPSGDVLITGETLSAGLTLSEAEEYATSTGTWQNVTGPITPRRGQTSTVLANGTILVAGGCSDGNCTDNLASAELYGYPGSIDVSFTGAWYDPAQSGHGILLEVLPGNRIDATWFAFNPAGNQQAWFSGAGSYSGNTATIANVIQPSGGRWIPNFNPTSIVRTPWGTLTFTFTDHDHGTVNFNSVNGYGSGSMSLTRLTQAATQTGSTTLPSSIGPAFTGSWYDPAQSGHGLMLEVLSGNNIVATWFAFDGVGQQAWFSGDGTYSGNTATIANMVQPTAGRWIPDFNPTAIVRNSWGTLTFTFSDCNHGRVDFNSVLGYGAGSMNLTRLTLPAGLTCP